MEKFSAKKSQAYHPVNTAILRAFEARTDDVFTLNSEPVEIIEIVAKVEDVVETGIRYEFRFSDEQGEFTGVVYRKSGHVLPGLKGYDMGRRNYALIIGSVKRFHNSLTVVIANMRAVYDFQTVLNHRLRVVWAYYTRIGKLTLEKKPLQTGINPAIRNKVSPVQDRILAGMKKMRPENVLLESEKTAFARQLNLDLKELDRQLEEMARLGYLYRDEMSSRYVAMNLN